MADIKSYMKEKQKREQKQAGYKEKIMRYKLVSVYRVLLVLAGAAALVALIVVQYRRHVYTDYDIVSSYAMESAYGTTDIRLGNTVLTYSKDGAHCTDARGESIWNQTYQIQDIKMAVCQDTVAIADYNGRNIYVQNSKQQLGTITTNMPIRDITVANTGWVTAVLADTNLAHINTYDPSGKLRYEGKAYMDVSGYPGALSLSPNGELLCVAYMYVDAGVLRTTVTFYNYTEIGKSQQDLMVSYWSYNDLVVPMVRFMNDSTAFAVGDSRLMIYTGNRKPVSAAEKLFDEEVLSVYYNESYVGLVFRADDSEHLYRFDVYDTQGELAGKFYFDKEYTDLFFDKDNIVIYNESECMILTMGGIVKYNGSFSKTVRLMLPAQSAYRYILVTDNSIDTIQLR